MLTFNWNKAELEADFQNAGIAETGLSLEELKTGLLQIAEREKEGSHPIVKAKAFAYQLDNMRIGVSGHDLFVTLGVWGTQTVRRYDRKGLGRTGVQRPPQRIDCLGAETFRFDYISSRLQPQRSGLGCDPFAGVFRTAEPGRRRGKTVPGSRRKQNDAGTRGLFHLHPD